MTKTSHCSLFLASCVLTSAVFAQTPAPAPSEPAPSETKKKSRMLSPEASSALLAGYSYQPPKPVEPVDDEIDQRDVDKPRNEIIRLPKYMVEAERPPVFADRNLYTTQNFSKLLIQRYLGKGGLNKYQLGKEGQIYAAQMYWDDERLKNMVEGNNQVSLYRASGDEEKAAKAERENKSMMLRTNDAQSAELSKNAGQRY
ncbi:MAG: hypothetical protein QM760_21820 [Nibricoccus sp.]